MTPVVARSRATPLLLANGWRCLSKMSRRRRIQDEDPPFVMLETVCIAAAVSGYSLVCFVWLGPLGLPLGAVLGWFTGRYAVNLPVIASLGLVQVQALKFANAGRSFMPFSSSTTSSA